MEDKTERAALAAELRRLAEETYLNRAPALPENPAALPPEELKRILHELRVHQIELEMQNEELRRAQAELDAQRERYFDLYDLAPAGYFTVSEKGIILQANLTAAKQLGAPRNTLAGRPFSQFILKEDQDIYYRHRKQLFETGKLQACELRLLKKDDIPFWVRLEANTAEDAGAPACRIIVSDITQRKSAEEIILEQAAVLNSILDSTGFPIFSIDRYFTYTHFNRAHAAVIKAQYGIDLKREDSLAVYQTVPEDWKDSREHIDRALRGESFTVSASSRTGGAEGRQYEITYYPARPEGGEVIGVSVFVRDVTEAQRLEKRERQGQKMEAVGLLAGGIAHDFNNTLTAIKCYGELVVKALRPEDPARADMGEIMTAAEHAAILTRQLLSFSRKQIIAPKVLDLNVVLGKMASLLRRLIGENIKLTTSFYSAPCLINIDPSQLEQMLVNLALNARDAVLKDGEIKLETELLTPPEEFFGDRPELARGPLVCLKVRDNGCGMGAAEKAQLFEPFYTTKEQGKGTGLGLAMVYGTVKQSGGEITVESTPGKGSVFALYFPLAARAAAEPAAVAPAAALKEGTETVLLVEDEEPLRRLGERILRAGGYTVLSAADGQAALAAAERHGRPVDLLLTDLVMPGMTGRELALELGRRKIASRTLYMSGYTEDAIAKQGVLEPGIAFIYKPFTVEALSAKLREVLDGPADQAKA